VADTPEQRLSRLEGRLADLDDARTRLTQLEARLEARLAKVDELDDRLGRQELRPPRLPAPPSDHVRRPPPRRPRGVEAAPDFL
jgi:hypothetical protein